MPGRGTPWPPRGRSSVIGGGGARVFTPVTDRVAEVPGARLRQKNHACCTHLFPGNVCVQNACIYFSEEAPGRRSASRFRERRVSRRPVGTAPPADLRAA